MEAQLGCFRTVARLGGLLWESGLVPPYRSAPYGETVGGLHTCGAGPYPAVLFHKTAEMTLGFESNIVKKDQNTVKMRSKWPK